MTSAHPADRQIGRMNCFGYYFLLLSACVLLSGCGDLGMTGSTQKDGVEKGKSANVYEPWEGHPAVQISNLQIDEDGDYSFDCATSASYGTLEVCIHLAGDPRPVSGHLLLTNFFMPGEKTGTIKGSLGTFGRTSFKSKLKTGCEVYLATGVPHGLTGRTKISNSLIYGDVAATVPQPIPAEVRNPPTDELGLVALPQDLVLPAGTMLMKNNYGKYIGLTVVENCAAGQKVKAKRDQSSAHHQTYERDSLMINALVLEDLRENLFEIWSDPGPDLVPFPGEDFPYPRSFRIYVKVDGKWSAVSTGLETAQNPSKLSQRKSFKGHRFDRSDIFITRQFYYELQRLKSRIPNLVPLPKNRTLPRGTVLYEKEFRYWSPAEAVSWEQDEKYKIKYVNTARTETVDRFNLYIDRDLLASIPDPTTTVASAPEEDVELPPGTPCRWITEKGALNARVVEQLSDGQIKIEHYSRSGPETQLVERSELRVPGVWLTYLAAATAGGAENEALRPPLEETPWFEVPRPPKFKAKMFLDLSSKFNRDLRKPFGRSPLNVLQNLEPGYYNMGGTDFHITGQAVQLNCNQFTDYKAFVRIPVYQKVNSLEVLHATMYGSAGRKTHFHHVDDGTVVGKFVFEYDSDETATVPIVYGENVRSWWSWEPSETTNAELVWTGDNPQTQRNGVRLRFYKFTLKNPRPEEKISHLLYESSMDTVVAPFCLAITVGE